MRSSTDPVRLNTWRQLEYHDPEQTLRRLRELQYMMAGSDLPAEVMNLRRSDLRKYLEFRQAALFAFGISQRIGTTVYFAPSNVDDYDVICSWRAPEDTVNYAPLQLKELPPRELNPETDLEGALAKLSRYRSSPDLQVAIHLNRRDTIDLGKLKVPELDLAGVWLVAGADPNSRRWMLIGDLLNGPEITHFDHPEPESTVPGV